jgi:excisionase family DNA binding protein
MRCLFPDNRARYASIGGKPNPQQPELIRMAAAHGCRWTAKSSRRWMQRCRRREAFRGCAEGRCNSDGPSRSALYVQEPFGFKDWNDQLAGKTPACSFPCARRCLRSPDGDLKKLTPMPQILTPPEAAALLHMDARTLVKWAREGYVPAHPLGEGKRRLWRFFADELLQWVTAQGSGKKGY